MLVLQQINKNSLQALEKITYSNNWTTILLLLLFASIILLSVIDQKKVRENFFAILNFTLIEDEDLEGNSFFDVFQILIFTFSVSVLSLLVYYFKISKTTESTIEITSFLPVFIGLILYFITKRLLEYALLLLFRIKSKLRFFIYLKNNYLYSISFLLYIALILFEYAGVNMRFVIFFAGFLFILRFAFLIIRNKKLIFNELFYFILYICALEIAPLFVLFKWMF